MTRRQEYLDAVEMLSCLEDCIRSGLTAECKALMQEVRAEIDRLYEIIRKLEEQK